VVIVHLDDAGPVEVARHARATPGSPALDDAHFPPSRGFVAVVDERGSRRSVTCFWTCPPRSPRCTCRSAGIERRWRLSPGAASSARLLKRGRSYRPGAGGPGLGRVSSRSSSSTSEAARTPHGRGSSRGGAPGRAAAARASSGRLTPPPAPRRIGWHGIRSPATLTSCWLSSAERSIGACATTRPGPRSTDDLTVTAAAPRARLVPARPRPPGEPRPSTAPRRPRPVDRARAPSPDGGGSPWSVPCRRWSAGWGFRRGWGSAPFRRGARVGSAAS